MGKPYIIETNCNPFNASNYFIESTDSTMNDAKEFAKKNSADGTTIRANEQTKARGRVADRSWQSNKGENLLCTTILKRPLINGFTLRVGLAIARTIESFLFQKTTLQIKWPNDVLFEGYKLSGILCESDSNYLYAGVGINWHQENFNLPPNKKATSVSILYKKFNLGSLPTTTILLYEYLKNLKIVLEEDNWQEEISNRLYMKNKEFYFTPGRQNSNPIEGVILDIGKSGELIFLDKNQKTHHFFSGELD